MKSIRSVFGDERQGRGRSRDVGEYVTHADADVVGGQIKLLHLMSASGRILADDRAGDRRPEAQITIAEFELHIWCDREVETSHRRPGKAQGAVLRAEAKASGFAGIGDSLEEVVGAADARADERR